MASGALGDQILDSLKGIFDLGSRYHVEKIGVIAGFVVLSLIIPFWAFSGPDDTNELGAELYLRDSMVGFELILENAGSKAWRDVRVVLDRRYVFTAEQIEGGDYVSLGAEDVVDAYYIPRPWGREDWEELADEREKPGMRPDSAYEPTLVQVRAREGRIDIEDLERRGN